jgi:hypothetical protein
MSKDSRVRIIRSTDLERALAAARVMDAWDAIDQQAFEEGRALQRAKGHRSSFQTGHGAQRRNNVISKDQAVYDEKLVEKFCRCRFCDATILLDLSLETNGLCFGCFIAERATAMSSSKREALRIFG